MSDKNSGLSVGYPHKIVFWTTLITYLPSFPSLAAIHRAFLIRGVAGRGGIGIGGNRILYETLLVEHGG